MKRAEDSSLVQTKESKARRNCYRVWTIIGGIILAIVAGYILNVLAIPVGIILWTAIIVFILRSPVNSLEKRGVNRAVGATIAYIGLLIVMLGIGFLTFSPAFGIGEQFMNLVESIPGYIDQISQWYNQIASQYAGFLQNETVQGWINEAASALGTWASEVAKSSAGGLVAVGGTVVNSFMVIGFSLVVAFWILMDLPALGKECRRLIPERRAEDAQMLYITFTRVMGGYIKATIIQCLLIGLLCGIAFAIIGIPNAAALGGIAGLLNIIPVVGPWFGGALAAIVGIFVSPLAALLALVATIAIQQIIYTFVSPKLMSNSVNIHPALVILALLAGSAIGGAMNGLMGSLVGMLASIPAVAVIKAIFVYYFEKNTGRRIVSPDGVFFKGTPTDIGGQFVTDPVGDAAMPPNADPKEFAEKKGFSSLRDLMSSENAEKEAPSDDEAYAKPEKPRNDHKAEDRVDNKAEDRVDRQADKTGTESKENAEGTAKDKR